MSRALESTLARHRLLTVLALGVLTLLAWGWLLTGAGMDMTSPPSPGQGAMSGDMAPGSMAAMAPAAGWTASRFLLTFAMWWVMMVAMMLPSAAPMILLYARVARNSPITVHHSTPAFLAGYLLAWGAFSLGAALLQQEFERAALVGPMTMAATDMRLSGLILLAAGLYQLSPFKGACLNHCRNPAGFLSRHYRPGQLGALSMGLLHGSTCVGCCWLLMALLFVGGVMNLAWIALLTLMVAAEKLLPFGRQLAQGLGILCLGAGVLFLIL